MSPATLLLYYDPFHTPLRELREAVPSSALVLCVDVGGGAEEPPPGEFPPGWTVLRVDARARFCDGYVTRAVKANARYQSGYYLSAALSRPLLAEVCVEVCRERGVRSVVHGLAGNDQLRFEMALAALAPDLRRTPVASLLGSRNDANPRAYTVSENLWGRSCEGGGLGDPWSPPPPGAFSRSADPAVVHAPPKEHVLRFERGIPVAVDGMEMPVEDVVGALDELGGRFGFGCVDLVEDGYVGLKTRALYEHPAACALVAAHRDLERLVSSRLQNQFKAVVDLAWAELVYAGSWFDPQREALDAYVDAVNRRVTGEVRLLFTAGGVHVRGRRSRSALYREEHSIYRAGQDFGVEAVPALAEMFSIQMREAMARPGSENGGMDDAAADVSPDVLRHRVQHQPLDGHLVPGGPGARAPAVEPPRGRAP